MSIHSALANVVKRIAHRAHLRVMETIKISGTQLEVSRVGLGTWAIGGWMWGRSDEKQSIKTIRTAIDSDITLIDTAPVYGFGHSEEIVGKALAAPGLRQRVAIATKVGLDWQGGQPFRDASRGRIFAEIEASLKRLRTDYIDIYQVHWPDPETPLEETAAAMLELYQQGKIRAIGVSNFSPAQMDRFGVVAPIHSLQPPYNLFERGIEKEVLPYCLWEGIATMAYGPICRGLLSGRMRVDTLFDGDDLRKTDPKFQGVRYAEYLQAVERLDLYAREKFDKRVIQLALRWVLDQPGVSVALWGARRPDQLAPINGAMGWSLNHDALRMIDRIVRESIADPVGPEFMAPPTRERLAA
jgi:aryl-alcohol dehydrogenase-like predicted oxidoreductase